MGECLDTMECFVDLEVIVGREDGDGLGELRIVGDVLGYASDQHFFGSGGWVGFDLDLGVVGGLH